MYIASDSELCFFLSADALNEEAKKFIEGYIKEMEELRCVVCVFIEEVS